MEKADGVQSAQLPTEQNGRNGKNEGTKDDSKLTQFPPVLLQKIASMLSDGGERLEYRDRIRFGSVNRLMNAAVRSNIDRMQRRPMVFRMEETYNSFNDIKINNQPSSGFTPTECVHALLAFGRPNDIRILRPLVSDSEYFPKKLALQQSGAERDRLKMVEGILASIPPSSILRLRLRVFMGEFDEGTTFYRILTHIGKMVNLERLNIDYFFYGDDSLASAHMDSSPSLPPGSPFLQLVKLEKLRALHTDWGKLLTPAQHCDLINRSSSNLTHICLSCEDEQALLLPSLDDRVCANITNLFYYHVVDVDDRVDDQFPDQLQDVVERLPQCTDVFAKCEHFPGRWVIDQVGSQLLESALALGGNRKMTVRLNVPVFPLGGQIEFIYEHESVVIKVLLVVGETYAEGCPYR